LRQLQSCIRWLCDVIPRLLGDLWWHRRSWRGRGSTFLAATGGRRGRGCSACRWKCLCNLHCWFSCGAGGWWRWPDHGHLSKGWNWGQSSRRAVSGLRLHLLFLVYLWWWKSRPGWQASRHMTLLGFTCTGGCRYACACVGRPLWWFRRPWREFRKLAVKAHLVLRAQVVLAKQTTWSHPTVLEQQNLISNRCPLALLQHGLKLLHAVILIGL